MRISKEFFEEEKRKKQEKLTRKVESYRLGMEKFILYPRKCYRCGDTIFLTKVIAVYPAAEIDWCGSFSPGNELIYCKPCNAARHISKVVPIELKKINDTKIPIMKLKEVKGKIDQVNSFLQFQQAIEKFSKEFPDINRFKKEVMEVLHDYPDLDSNIHALPRIYTLAKEKYLRNSTKPF